MAKTPDVVAREIIDKLKFTTRNGLSLELGTPERKIVDAVAESISEAYVDQYLVGSLMDLDSKAGLELEQWVGIFGFGRLQGRRATGTVQIELSNSNAMDISIPSGSPFYTRQALPSSGSPLFFQSTQAISIPTGSQIAEVPVECTVVGAAGNIRPDSIVFIGDIMGATSVTNLQAFTGGMDVETDDELRQRFKDTFLRNVAGTEDFYLGLCYQNKNISKAACFGPIKKYATQVAAGPGIDLASYTTQDVKYAWPGDGHVHAFHDLGQDTESFYQINQDFTWLAGPEPVFTWLPTGDIPEGEIVDLEFEYTTRSSRNDPVLGISNKVDIFVNGTDPHVVTERAVIDNAVRITNTAGDRLHRTNFTRVGAVYVRGTSSLTNATASGIAVTRPGGTTGPYRVVLSNTPTSGTFTLSYGGQSTLPIQYNATPTAIQAALVALSTINSDGANVTPVTGTGGATVPFQFNVALTASNSTLTGSATLANATASRVVVDGYNVSLTNTPTGGTYTLTFGAQTTGPLQYNASTSTVRAALEALSSIGSGNVTVAGTPTQYTLSFTAATKIPLANNRFMRLGSTPIASFPAILTVNGTSYTRGVHYHLLRLAPESTTAPNQTMLMAGSIFEVVGIEWESTGPLPVAPATTVPVTATYTYNRTPEVLQAMIRNAKQITTDVLVHEAAYAHLRVYLTVEYDRGFVVSQVNNAINDRLRVYFSQLPYGSWIEISDLTLAAHQVLGVDNVTLTVAGDAGAGLDHGVKVYANSADTLPIVTHDGDFKLVDNQLPLFLDAVIRRRANR